MLHIDFSNKRTLTSSVVYKQNEIDNKGVSAKLINVDLDENSSGAAFWTSPSGETMQTEFVIDGEIGTFKVPTHEIGTWTLELVVYNDGRPKSADYNFEILKSYSVDPSNSEIELLIETIVRHDHTYTQNESIRIENENTRIIEHNDRMNKSDVATTNAIQATHNADQATVNANEATQRANESAENAEHATENMVQLTEATVTATVNANAQAEYAKMQGDYAKAQGDHAKQAAIDASNATSLTNQTIQSANTATANAVNATNNAATATERANTATQQANTATANAETATQATIQATTEARSATANTIQATNNAQTATTNANTATTNANTATVNANTATTNANTATTKANQAVTSVQNAIAAGTVDLEPKQARTDATGFEHANLKTRLDEEFKELASKIPTDVAMNGYETVTTNDTLAGDVSGAVAIGQTLVNMCSENKTGTFNPGTPLILTNLLSHAWKTNTNYTVFYEVDNEFFGEFSFRSGNGAVINSMTSKTMAKGFVTTLIPSTAVTKEATTNPNIALAIRSGENVVNVKTFGVIEGDHTDKPLEFFEGLKSAEVAEIGTHGVNLVDIYAMHKNWTSKEPTYAKLVNIDGVDHISVLDGYAIYNNGFKIKVTKGSTYRIKTTVIWETSGTTTAVSVRNGDDLILIRGDINNSDKTLTFVAKGDYIEFVSSYNTSSKYFILKNLTLYEVTPNTPTEYIPYQSSTTSLPSPIKLRSLPNGISDTYDVDTGVLTRRCGEVVLNGSESWTTNATGTNTISFYIPILSNMKKNNEKGFCDKFSSETWVNEHQDKEYQWFATASFGVSITKSKLATPDIAGFKAWLTQNPVTVVYQLATPTTEYIENNGQLRSYDNQTTVFANSIVPLKLSANIPVNYASTLANLATQARNLQIENTALIEQAESLSEQLNIAEQTNNFQDELIDVSLMATDELYVMLEPLLAQPMSVTNTQNASDETTTNTQGGNAMVDAYVAMVIRGLKTIDEVPARYREEVRRILAELDK